MNVNRLAKEMNRQLEESMRADALTVPVLEILRNPMHSQLGLSANELCVPLDSDSLSVAIELNFLESRVLVEKSDMFGASGKFRITRRGKEYLDDRSDRLEKERDEKRRWKINDVRAWITAAVAVAALLLSLLNALGAFGSTS